MFLTTVPFLDNEIATVFGELWLQTCSKLAFKLHVLFTFFFWIVNMQLNEFIQALFLDWFDYCYV